MQADPAPQTPRTPQPPRATYRLQLGPACTFADVEEIAPYLADLGVSHLYLSPILEAVPGSSHGYDVVDHRRVRAALGGEPGWRSLGTRLGELGLGQVVDVVPNHMAVGPWNPWWWDVLENGAASRYAHWFDVDWEHPEANLRERILLPVLADHYGRVLEAGDLRLAWDGTRFSIRSGDDRFPVAPRSLDELLRRAAERAASDELAYLGDAFEALPPSSATDRSSVERRHRDKEVLARRLADLARDEAAVADALAATIATVNADVEALHRLLEGQNYRLAWWRAARRDLGYRRFFDVTTLVGLRAEDERVFAATHGLVLDWLESGAIDGVRIDHPDGLREPEGYLRRLRWASPRAWIVVEKILEPGEELRRSWPVDGTTGYDFLNRLQGVLLDPGGERPLTALWERVSDDSRSYEAIAREAKAHVLREVLGSELGRLTGLLVDTLEHHRRHRDHTRHDLHEALAAVLEAFPVYRTYVDPMPGADGRPASVAPDDEAAILAAVEEAAAARPDLPADLFGVIGDLLLVRLGTGPLEREFVARFQQLSGPVMAKGVEDTAFYRYLRLAALNEVGGDPGRWGTTVDDFHAAAAATQARWPGTMLATSTHDTKRSEDVRARLLVLAEVPDRWTEAVERWSSLAERHGADGLPDAATRYLAFQTLVGAWPITAERLATYLEKATREQKLHTSWTEPNEAYDRALGLWVERVMADDGLQAEIGAFARSVLEPGRINSLAQALLKLTSPGVPDIYQGSELWDLSLVDPDNRRAVDFGLRSRRIAELEGCRPDEVAARLGDPADPGLPKLWLTRAALHLRARRPDAFGPDGDYAPLAAAGDRAGHLIAYLRGGSVVTLAPRLPATLGGDWGNTTVELPDGGWREVLGGRDLEGGSRSVAEICDPFPLALLERRDR